MDISDFKILACHSMPKCGSTALSGHLERQVRPIPNVYMVHGRHEFSDNNIKLIHTD